jgi:hypothetical protein
MKKNEIIEEQKRAREEFLKLKKMQSGEIDAGPKPSEVAIVPKTFKEKWDNFWFQYRLRVVAVVFIVAVFVVCIAQCVSKPNYDIKMVYFSYTPVLDDQLILVEDYFNEIIPDINGDGEVLVQVINCSFSNTDSNVQYRNNILMKMQSTIVAEYDTMLYITDKESVKYFEGLSVDLDIFEAEPLEFNEDFYKKTVLNGKELPEGLGISCRKINDTVIEKYKDSEKYHLESMKILEKLKELS